MYGDRIPYRALKTGKDPIVDLSLVADFLRHAYDRESGSNYSNPNTCAALQQMAIAAEALCRVLGSGVARTVPLEDYAAAATEIADEMDAATSEAILSGEG